MKKLKQVLAEQNQVSLTGFDHLTVDDAAALSLFIEWGLEKMQGGEIYHRNLVKLRDTLNQQLVNFRSAKTGMGN